MAKKSNTKLSLDLETIRELTPDEMRVVNGGNAIQLSGAHSRQCTAAAIQFSGAHSQQCTKLAL